MSAFVVVAVVCEFAVELLLLPHDAKKMVEDIEKTARLILRRLCEVIVYVFVNFIETTYLRKDQRNSFIKRTRVACLFFAGCHLFCVLFLFGFLKGLKHTCCVFIIQLKQKLYSLGFVNERLGAVAGV